MRVLIRRIISQEVNCLLIIRRPLQRKENFVYFCHYERIFLKFPLKNPFFSKFNTTSYSIFLTLTQNCKFLVEFRVGTQYFSQKLIHQRVVCMKKNANTTPKTRNSTIEIVRKIVLYLGPQSFTSLMTYLSQDINRDSLAGSSIRRITNMYKSSTKALTEHFFHSIRALSAKCKKFDVNVLAEISLQ